MGDMGEIFKDFQEYKKETRKQRNEKYEPLVKQLGAIFKSEGIYEYNGWFLYPSKGFAMNKVNNKKRMSLDKFLKKENK